MANSDFTINFSAVPDAGTFTLSVALAGYTYTTSALAYSAADTAIQAALNTAIGNSCTSVVGSLATQLAVEFNGELADVAITEADFTASSSLTASAASVDITINETTAGTYPLSTWYWLSILVRNDIRDLSLPGFTSTNIVAQKVPIDRAFLPPISTLSYPGIIVSPVGVDAQGPKQGSNRRDDVAYPIVVGIYDSDVTLAASNRHTYWKERIAKEFRNQKLTGLPNVYKCELEPGPTGDMGWFNSQLYSSFMTLRFTNRETRG